MKTNWLLMIGMTCIAACALAAMEIQVHAGEGDKRTRTESGVFLEEDYLFLGHALIFSGGAEDLIFCGRELTFNGKADLGVFALGEKLMYTGEAGNGIMAGALDVAIDGLVEGNSFIGCKSMQVGEQALVKGNLFVACGRVTINGPVDGNVYAGAGEIVINSEITGNVVAHTGRITIGERGAIRGTLTYSATEKLNDREQARVAGAVEKIKRPGFDEDGGFPPRLSWMVQALIALGFFISFALVGSLLLFAPAGKKLDARQSPKAFWTTALWGLIPVLLYPALIILCFMLVITIPFAFVLVLAFAPLFYLANIIGSTLTGKYLALKFGWSVEKRQYHFLIGAVAGAIVSMIPFVNFLGFLFLSALGWGVFLMYLFQKDLTVSRHRGDTDNETQR